MLQIHSGVVRVLLLALGVFGLLLFLLPVTVRIVNVGNLFGAGVSAFLTAFVIWNRQISGFLKRIWQHGAGKAAMIALSAVIILGVLYCAVISAFMIRAANRKPKSEPAAIIVLGCKVRGTDPSLMLMRRIRTAYRAALQYPDAKVIVSGGKGSNEDISEAECMQRELIQMGLPAERILPENRSASTSENLRFSKEILDQNGLHGEVVLVTDAFHEFRASVLAELEGLPECSSASAKTSWYLVPTYWVREWFGVAHAYVFGN